LNKIFKNSFYNILQAIIVTPIFFILVPYNISKIGAEGYGLFALVGVISSYQVFVEMGLTTTIIRFVAKANVNKDIKAIGEYLSTALLIFLLISILALTLIFTSANFLATRILGIKMQIELAIFLIKISALTGIVNLISGLFKSILDGLQRMDISNAILTIQILLSALGTFYALESNYGIKGLIINGLIVSLLSLFANILFSKKLINYKINILRFNKNRFKEMFKYGVNLQLSSLIYFWTEPLNKIIISHFLGINFVGYYDIALKFSSRITNLVRSFLSSLFPASSEIFEKSGFDGIEILRNKSMKYIFPLVTFIYLIGLICTPSFVNLWLGNSYDIVSTAIIILLIGSILSILATPTYVLLLGAGYSNDTLKIQFQSILINVPTVILGALLFGFYGFCLGYSISMIYGFLATHIYYKKRFDSKLNVFKIFVNIKIFSFCFIILTTGILAIHYLPMSTWTNFSVFAITFFVFGIIALWKFKILTEKDISNLFGVNSIPEIVNNFRK